MSEFQKRLEANIRESLRFAVGEVQDDAVAHLVAGVNAVLNHPSAPAPAPHVDGWQPPQACDGKEQYAFEAWASSKHYDMHEHPLHYIFMDPKTNAARMGWNAALRYVREQFAEANPPSPQPNLSVTDEMVEAAHQWICRLYPYPQSKPETRRMLEEAWSVAPAPISKESGQ